jgi:hypothetical protein
MQLYKKIMGASLTEESWTQAALPVPLGGMGLQQASSHSIAAFLSSVGQTESLVNDLLGSFPVRIPIDVPLTTFRNNAGIP